MAGAPDLFRLDGRVALLTGAGRGLGWAMARALAEAGAHVVLNGRDADRLEARVGELRAEGLAASAAPFDVADEAAATAAVTRVIEAHGRLDVLVNNAGITYRMPIADADTAEWRRVIEVNLVACFALARCAGRHMAGRGAGRIINIASVLSRVARPGTSAYIASKHGLEGLTKALAVEFGPDGVTANAIAPGYFAAGMGDSLVDKPAFRRMVEGATPLGRWGEASELAGAVLFLASDAGSYVNGHLLLVDGGLSIAQ